MFTTRNAYRPLLALTFALSALAGSVLLGHADDTVPPTDAPALEPATVHTVFLPVVLKLAGAGPVNGNFESGSVGWTVYSTNNRTVIRNSGFPGSVVPHSGAFLAWLGGAYSELTYIQQSLTVPGSMPYLAYWHWIASADYCGYDEARVYVNGTLVDTYALCDPADTNGWVKHVVNLSAYAGQNVTLQIRATTDDSLNSNLFIDDVGFQASAGATADEVAAPVVPDTAEALDAIGND